MEDYVHLKGIFLDEEHEKVFYECLKKANVNKDDTERQSLFFILTHRQFLRDSIWELYDFKENCINLDNYQNKNTFSSGENALVEIAFNLYNGYGNTDLCSLFSKIDILSFEACFNAIRIRFKRLPVDYDNYIKYQEKLNKILEDRKVLQ